MLFDPAGRVEWSETVEPHNYRVTMGWRIWEFSAQLQAVRHPEEAGLVGAEVTLESCVPPVRLSRWMSVPIVVRQRWRALLADPPEVETYRVASVRD